MDKKKLKQEILKSLIDQGFKINPHIRPAENNKKTFKQIQQVSKIEQIKIHNKFLEQNFNLAKEYCLNGKELNPQKIKLDLILVRPDSLEEKLFKWWNFVWWSIPYQRPYGRQMRFLLWDSYHESPFGLLSLQSPILRMSVRDKFLGIPNDDLDLWVNRSMNAQRVGALPPYNQLLGGKMVALALASNEIRKAYKSKYSNYVSIIKKRFIEPDLLFATTTSAFGKSSLYNRLKYKNRPVAISLGYTQGYGSFHVPEYLYKKLIEYLKNEGIEPGQGFGNGPSRKLKIISQAFQKIGLPDFEYHGIKREFYLFPYVKNLKEIIEKNQKPKWINQSFNQLQNYWKKRWLIPRSERLNDWQEFNKDDFFSSTENALSQSMSQEIDYACIPRQQSNATA